MNLILYEDSVARRWAPFSSTRPIGEMLFGAITLRERIGRALGTAVTGYVAPYLEGFEESHAPPVLGDGPDVESAILLSSRYVPPLPGEPGHDRLSAAFYGSLGTARLVVDGAPAGWRIGSASELSEILGRLRSGSEDDLGPGSDVTIPGALLAAPWNLMAGNADRLTADLATSLRPDRRELEETRGVTLVGSGRVTVEQDVEIDPACVLDTRSGPIHLAEGVRVRPFTYLRGPAFVGRGTSLFGGTFEALSVGPGCKLRGEISEAVFLGYANKAHDGYIGHSVLGRWVNLGALTTNSDLKNNYGEIRVGTSGGSRDTGMIKVGVFLGDHVKTGIGTRLNGGTVVGAGSNLFGDGFPPRWVPPFHWGTGSSLVPHRLEAFLETAERAMARRDISLSPAQRAFLTRAWEREHGSAS